MRRRRLIIQLYPFLNIIRIFSESYFYMLKMQNRCHIHYSNIYIFEYYPYIFEILFIYVKNTKHASYSLFNIFEYYWNIFWILFDYFLNLIRIWWTCKTSVIFIIQLYIFLNIICIFLESYSYILKMKNSIKTVYDLNIISIWNKKKVYISIIYIYKLYFKIFF